MRTREEIANRCMLRLPAAARFAENARAAIDDALAEVHALGRSEGDHGLRPGVLAFARAMEAKLRSHDADRGPSGWKTDAALGLWCRLMEEAEELRRALVHGRGNDEIASEAADVGNFAMMVADVCGALRAPSPKEDAPAVTHHRRSPVICGYCGRAREDGVSWWGYSLKVPGVSFCSIDCVQRAAKEGGL